MFDIRQLVIDDDGDIVGAIMSMSTERRGPTDRELALDFLLCYIVDALHDGRLVLTRDEIATWRSQAQARRQWGSIYDAHADDEDADMTLRVNWQDIPRRDDDDGSVQ